MVEGDSHPDFGDVGRGHAIGPGLLFIVTQALNVTTGEVRLEGRPLRENHQHIVDFTRQGERTITLDGRPVVLSREALTAYSAAVRKMPKLTEWVVTNIVFMDPTQYQSWILTGRFPQ